MVDLAKKGPAMGDENIVAEQAAWSSYAAMGSMLDASASLEQWQALAQAAFANGNPSNSILPTTVLPKIFTGVNTTVISGRVGSDSTKVGGIKTPNKTGIQTGRAPS